jgi:small nuclear ribonucleoprotein (snRNP)-like protein
MKKIYLSALILWAAGMLCGVSVFLDNGMEYQGTLRSVDAVLITLEQEEVIIQIPVRKVRAVLDNGTDTTKEVLGKALEAVGVDAHFLGADDYFISEQPLSNQPTLAVKLGKCVGAAYPAAGTASDFILLQDGEVVTTSNWFRTTLAQPKEIRKGDYIIYFAALQDGFYRAPLNEDETMSGEWRLAKVTDVSFAGNGFITVAGENDVATDNIRIIGK